jgi:hypothetical protein
MIQMELKGVASKKNAIVPETAEMNRTKFLGRVSASQPKNRERGTPRKSRNPKMNAPVCSSIPFHTMIGIICSITPALAVSLRILPVNSSQ